MTLILSETTHERQYTGGRLLIKPLPAYWLWTPERGINTITARNL